MINSGGNSNVQIYPDCSDTFRYERARGSTALLLRLAHDAVLSEIEVQVQQRWACFCVDPG